MPSCGTSEEVGAPWFLIMQVQKRNGTNGFESQKETKELSKGKSRRISSSPPDIHLSLSTTEMSLLRGWRPTDLFTFNQVNLDAFTETYSISYYLNNLSTWPDLFCATEDANGNLMGYSATLVLVHMLYWLLTESVQ